MKKLFIIIITLTMLLCSCQNKEVIATINDKEIYLSDIEDDITFIMNYNKYDSESKKAYDIAFQSALDAYLIDYMCYLEMQELGLEYKEDYYSMSYETLIDAHGSSQKLNTFIKSLGLDEDYITELCKRHARKATLTEYMVSSIEIPEEDILQYYIENASDFKEENVRSLYTLYFPTYNDAINALEEIESVGFINYYNQQETEQTTSYYFYFEHVSMDELGNDGEKIFALNSGEYYNTPVLCNVGYALFYVDNIIENYQYTYEEMKEVIKEAMIDLKENDILASYFEDLNKKYTVKLAKQQNSHRN